MFDLPFEMLRFLFNFTNAIKSLYIYDFWIIFFFFFVNEKSAHWGDQQIWHYTVQSLQLHIFRYLKILQYYHNIYNFTLVVLETRQTNYCDLTSWCKSCYLTPKSEFANSKLSNLRCLFCRLRSYLSIFSTYFSDTLKFKFVHIKIQMCKQ